MQTNRTTDPVRAEAARLASELALTKVREARKARAGNGVRTYAHRWPKYAPTANAPTVTRKERAVLRKRAYEYWI